MRLLNRVKPHFPLRSNVPVPGRADLSSIYPFAVMKVGQSFVIKDKRRTNSVRASISRFYRHNKGSKAKFTVRFDRKRREFGCWRIK